MWPNPLETEEIVNGKLHFLCSVYNVRTRGYFNISHLLIYIYKRHEVHQKDNVRGWCQKVKKNSKKKKKRKERECFSNMTFMIGK